MMPGGFLLFIKITDHSYQSNALDVTCRWRIYSPLSMQAGARSCAVRVRLEIEIQPGV